MVTAGKPVDSVIQSLKPLLEEGDVIMDGGNSHYEDTERRYDELKDKGIGYLGVGISGGEVGALTGLPSCRAEIATSMRKPLLS